MKEMVMPSTFSVLENEEMMNVEGGCHKHHHHHHCCPQPVVVCRPVVICRPVICRPVICRPVICRPAYVFGC